jgi:hypothetical protein
MRRLWHVTVVTEDQRNAFPTAEDRLRAVRRLVALHGDRLLWFCVSDTHDHELLEADEAEIPLLRRDLTRVLRGLTRLPFTLPHAKPVVERAHLESCLPYIVGNREHHGLVGDSLADPGSSLADLLGARLIDGFDRHRWEAHLPRLKPEELAARFGLPPLAPVSLEAVRAAGPANLVRMAAAAVAAPNLTGRRPEVVRARTAVVHLGLRAGIAKNELAWALGGRRQTVPERTTLAPEPALEAAILRFASLEAALASPRRTPIPRRGR